MVVMMIVNSVIMDAVVVAIVVVVGCACGCSSGGGGGGGGCRHCCCYHDYYCDDDYHYSSHCYCHDYCHSNPSVTVAAFSMAMFVIVTMIGLVTIIGSGSALLLPRQARRQQHEKTLVQSRIRSDRRRARIGNTIESRPSSHRYSSKSNSHVKMCHNNRTVVAVKAATVVV